MDLLLILRGLAAIAVVVWHSVGFQGEFPAVLNVPGRGAVWLFFGISGYVIAYGFVHQRYQLTPRGFGAFYTNRLLRIFPLFLFLSGVAWALEYTRTGVSPLHWIDVPAQLLAVQFDQNYRLNGVFWTLGIEIQFYLLAPLLVLPLLPRGHRWVAGAVVMYAASVVWVHVASRVLGWPIDSRNILGSLPHFLAGMIACRAVVGMTPERRRGWICLIAGCGLLAFANRLYQRHYVEFLSTQGILVMDAAIALFVVAHASWEPLPRKRGRVLAAFALLGTLSYGVYAWHPLLMTNVPWTAERVIPLVALSIAAATLSYWLIERPALKLKFRRPLHGDSSASLAKSMKEDPR